MRSGTRQNIAVRVASQTDGLDNYGLTDQWLRRRLNGDGTGLCLPAPNPDHWPVWHQALSSPQSSLRQSALLLLRQPIDMEEVDHFQALAENHQGLFRTWQSTGLEEIFEVILGLAEAVDDWPGLESLAGMLARGEIPYHLLDRTTALARPLPREVIVRTAGAGVLSELDELHGPAEGHSLARFWAVLGGEIPVPAGPRGDIAAGRAIRWGRWTGSELAYLEELFRPWAGELARTRDIAARVSARTGLVVVALFNANLAASLRWGIPPVDIQAGPVAEELATGISARNDRARASAMGPASRKLKNMFAQRAVAPDLKRFLATLADGLALNNRAAEVADWLETARELGPDPVPDRDALSGPWPMDLRSPAQLARRVEGVIDRGREALLGWEGRLAGLLARARAGGDLLDRGRLDSLVVPLVDKFSASTRAGLDLDYLTGWLGLLRQALPRALFLLFDDTDRPDCALTRVIDRADRLMGGVYGLDPFGSLAGDNPVQTIAGRASAGEIYALRPCARRRRSGGLAELLARGSAQDLEPGIYDPCWKDGLSVLLSGTGQRPVGRLEGPPLFPETIATTTGVWPMGAWCRARLTALLKEG